MNSSLNKIALVGSMKFRRLVLFPATMAIIFGMGCQNSEKEVPAIQIETYSKEDLVYPGKEQHMTPAAGETFVERFFLPWTESPEKLLNYLDSLPGKDLSYLKNYLDDDAWYGENKKPHKKFLREEIANTVDMADFPNFLEKGIVTAHTNLRRIPTHRPGFDTYSKAGEGFPFDYFQETNLWANTPLQLLHITTDRQWCYAVSPYYKGWVPMRDLAIVSKGFMTTWLTGDYAIPLSDRVNLSDPKSKYALNAKMGMVLPYEADSNKPSQLQVYYANADENQDAHILRAPVSKDLLALEDFVFNAPNLKSLVSQLLGRPYGWGGNLENRDCSSMIRDLLATYQVWLPRDSKDQIAVGKHHELTGSAQNKMQLIKEKGIPFLTILRKKGHNMLYVGHTENGEPLIFHAIWGLKTRYANEELGRFLSKYPIEGLHQEADGQLSGRHIIGESVITSVTAGSGNGEIITPLIEEIYAMTNILEE